MRRASVNDQVTNALQIDKKYSLCKNKLIAPVRKLVAKPIPQNKNCKNLTTYIHTGQFRLHTQAAKAGPVLNSYLKNHPSASASDSCTSKNTLIKKDSAMDTLQRNKTQAYEYPSPSKRVQPLKYEISHTSNSSISRNQLMNTSKSRSSSRCNSARSSSLNLRNRYDDIIRIQKENIKIVEKILLVQPTLSKKEHLKFYKQQKEHGNRLSRYAKFRTTGSKTNKDSRLGIRKNDTNDIRQPSSFKAAHAEEEYSKLPDISTHSGVMRGRRMNYMDVFRKEYKYDRHMRDMIL